MMLPHHTHLTDGQNTMWFSILAKGTIVYTAGTEGKYMHLILTRAILYMTTHHRNFV